MVNRMEGRADEPEGLVIKQQAFHHQMPSWKPVGIQSLVNTLEDHVLSWQDHRQVDS